MTRGRHLGGPPAPPDPRLPERLDGRLGSVGPPVGDRRGRRGTPAGSRGSGAASPLSPPVAQEGAPGGPGAASPLSPPVAQEGAPLVVEGSAAFPVLVFLRELDPSRRRKARPGPRRLRGRSGLEGPGRARPQGSGDGARQPRFQACGREGAGTPEPGRGGAARGLTLHAGAAAQTQAGPAGSPARAPALR